MGDIDAHLLDQTRPEGALPPEELDGQQPPKFLEASTDLDRGASMFARSGFEADDEATRMASVDSISRKPRPPAPPRAPGKRPLPRPLPGVPGKAEDATRSVDIRDSGINDPSINDIDWDID